MISPRQPNPPHNLPLLRITDTRGVEAIGKLVGRPSRFVTYEGGGEVLRHARALTLSDEPLAGDNLVFISGPLQLHVERQSTLQL